MKYRNIWLQMMLLIGALFVVGCEEESEGDPTSEAYLPMAVGPQGADNGTVLTCTGVLTGTPAVLCVDKAYTGSTTNGLAATPYKTIASAITAAKAGDTIQIAQGTYLENPVIGAYNSFNTKRLNILGGFQSGSNFAVRNQALYKTLLDNNLANVGLRLFINAGSNNMTVDGLAIRRGKGLGTTYLNGYGHGGGVYVQWVGTGVLTLSHLEVYDSQTNAIAANSQQGGGIWATTTANGTTTGRVKIEDSYIHDNKGGKGAGVSGQGNIDLYRNRIESNLGQNDHGGGFYFAVSGGAFEYNLVKSNTIGVLAGYGWGGGGVFVGGSANLKGNVFTLNSAPSIGSGVYFDDKNVATMTNDLLFKNNCPNNAASGAAVYIDGLSDNVGDGTSVTMTNVTIADHNCSNQGTSGGTVYLERRSTVVVKNSIFHGNYRDFGASANSTFSATYTKTSQVTGTGNITSDPLFVNATSNDYHLKSTAGHFTSSGWVTDSVTSPAIDAGDTTSAFANEPSPNGSRINMGWEGNTDEASKSASLDYEDCPGQPYTIALNSTQTISGNAGSSDDDQIACGTTSGDRVYRLNLAQTEGILSLSIDSGTFALRTTCSSSSGEVCDTSHTLEAVDSTYYVVVEGSGAFNLMVDYDASVCGDGFVSSTEECEAPTLYCVAPGDPGECTSSAPDPTADACPGKPYTVLQGVTNLSSEAEEFTTVNYTDDYDATCGSEPDGRDYVLLLTPDITGTLTVRVGLSEQVCEDNAASEFCWDVILSARSTCTSDLTEIACVNDSYAGEEMAIPVTANVPVSVLIDGFNGGWYSYGPFDVQLELNP